jgi:hypothetical protein
MVTALSNRLKKLEINMGSGGGFCICQPQATAIRVYYPDSEPAPWREPGRCERCGGLPRRILLKVAYDDPPDPKP